MLHEQLQWPRSVHPVPPADVPRPYKRGVWLSGLLAALAMGATVAIPALTGAAINAVEGNDGDQLKLLALLIVAAGVARLVLTVLRRIIAGQVSLGVEYDLRNRLYEHLMALELGFFDHNQTGQLMSRATVDLSAVRFFLGYGLVLISQAILTILLAATAMFIIDPGLALVSLCTVPFVIWVAGPLQPPLAARAAGGPAADRGADRGRRGERRRRARRQGVRARGPPARALRHERRARLRAVDDLDAPARVLHAVHRLPAAGRPRGAAVHGRQGRHRRAPEPRRVHGVLRLHDRAARPDAVDRLDPRAVAARDRLRAAHLRAARPRARDRRGARRRRRCPPATAGSSCARRRSPTRRTASRRSTTSR